MELNIDLVDMVRPDSECTSFDYRKFSVKDKNGKFLTHIFELKGGFLNLKSSKFFETKEEAARAAFRS
jgi:hypothetical protein